MLYNIGAKLSVFTMLVPNCPFSYLGAKLSVCLLGAKLSVCLLGAELSVFTILVPNCPGAKLSYYQISNFVLGTTGNCTMISNTKRGSTRNTMSYWILNILGTTGKTRRCA